MLVKPLETSRQVEEQEWRQLIAQTAQGDQGALATLYDRTSPQVYGLVFKILDNREAAEEVTLDVYTQVWRQAHTYDQTRGTPGGWLMTLARTRAIDRFRAGAAKRRKIESLDAVEFFASGDETPEQDLVGQKRRRYVRQALKVLTAEQRQAITSHGPHRRAYGCPARSAQRSDVRQGVGRRLAGNGSGVSAKFDLVSRRATALVRMAPGSSYAPHRHVEAEELYVLEGGCFCGGQELTAGDYHRAEAGTEHHDTSSDEGCLLLIVSSPQNEMLQ